MKYVSLVLIAALLLAGCTQAARESQPSPTQEPSPVNEPQAQPSPQPQQTATVKEFDMTARKFEFSPDTIRVQQGDRVKLRITSMDVEHGFSIPEFSVNENLEPGKTTTVEFAAAKKGTFEFACSVFCGEGHREMTGTLIVE